MRRSEPVCKIIQLPDGGIRDETSYVLNFGYDLTNGIYTLERDLIVDNDSPSSSRWSFPTAVSFLCEKMFISKKSDEEVQIQMNVGAKSCARLLFTYSSEQYLVEQIGPLQTFGFSFPGYTPMEPFKIYLTGLRRFPVP